MARPARGPLSHGPVEIERKFLVRDDSWQSDDPGIRYRQGYLCRGERATVRVRVSDSRAWLTIKGPTRGITRTEHEYEIPPAEAAALLEHACDVGLIDKTRYRVPYGDHTWEVDEFHGSNRGLVLAEVELANETERPALPDWLGREVSHDARYRNSQLAEHPYREWGPEHTRD